MRSTFGKFVRLLGLSFRALVVILPWPLKRFILARAFKYQIHPDARIGLAWAFPQTLKMEEGACIDHFTVAIHLERMEMGPFAMIGRSNWITGFPRNGERGHFQHLSDREPALVMGAHSAVTKGHHIDCTARIDIGSFSTVAGYQSQLLTHSVDIYLSRQHAAPIRIGHHCFVGTRCLVFGGASLPDCSVLGAGSLLNKSFDQSYGLYAGSPARFVKAIPEGAAYFSRSKGFII